MAKLNKRLSASFVILWLHSFLLLCLFKSAVGFDLLSSLMSQSSSLPNIKSLVSPEMLSKVKGLLPSMPQSHGPGDVSEIEKLIIKLKPIEGRFDPAVLELLANMDARMPPGLTNQKLDPSRHQHHHHHHHELPHGSSTTAATGLTITTPDGKPKFSSKFRLEEAEEQEESSEGPPHSSTLASLNSIPQIKSLDHITDPNIRNHRLYELEQQRFENYENFTALDQIEDLMAEESHPHEVFIPFENPKQKSKKRYKSTTIPSTTSQSSTTSGTSGWIGKPYTRRRPLPPPNVTPTTFSYEEDVVSVESSAAADDSTSSQMIHDREPLKYSSTEKTVIYHRQSGQKNKKTSKLDKSNSDKSTRRPTTNRFKPSPVDLSTPLHFEPDQDFYTSTINKGSKGNRRRHQLQRQQSHNDNLDSASTNDYHHHQQQQPSNLNMQTNSMVFSDHDQEYRKEQPDFQHAVNYIQSTMKNMQPDVYLPNTNKNNNNNNVQGDELKLASKQDRILHNHNLMPTIPPMYPPPYSMPTPITGTGDMSRLKNPYYVAASSDHIYETQPPQQQYYQVQSTSPNDLAYSAGQNYYHGWPSHQGGGSDGSWTSTFLLLGGLIALSAIVAFFLPSFLAGAATGKDTGDIDKISEAETDLWTEIKGLYGDIVNIAKGDYTALHRQGLRPTSDLPNIQIIDQLEEDSDGKPVINKRHGIVSDDDDQSDEQNISSSSGSQDAEDEEEDESLNSGLEKPSPSLRKSLNVSDTLAFGVFAPNGKVGKNSYNSSSQNLNFANAFNQTLQAWEKVRLIVH